ncbi:inositol hexakisphosphate and diphosphoinositol-pentakisphosphate kinase 2 [Elysia marginata]|uniref:Inositol hexakisphosphate and diphosphoinositol-pentakisphosphate kinase 2 n=1 Tax=Elysia marginata TaxID=1093978 RepID=A0AAV4IJC6_9GAST|nr:inositol hexakisphosphate and diphosphoinositol-pentakisphosphate kinase 2 [Elysia marginata]
MADWSVLPGWSVFTSVAVWGAFDSQNFLRCAQCEKISFRTFKEPLDLDLDQARTNLDYSTKNIPTHGKDLYTKILISKTETFVLKNLRWRAFFFFNPDIKCREKETYGFNSSNPPPAIQELKEFENELTELISNIKFKKASISSFQKRLKKDIDNIKKDDHLYVPADKSCNFYRLINPCKPEIGKISKHILERIVTTIQEKTNANQWRNTKDVLNWFEKINNKNDHTFISFDICDFYPSINESLLDQALQFASQYTTITAEEQHIIKHTKKTTLYHNCTPWRKKTSNFDVTMGSYDGAETCELVGLFLLSQLKEIDANVGLYRDDGLVACRLTPRQAENTKKRICEVFQNYGLKISIEANKKIVNFLDVTLDLRNDSYKPYKKPNDNVSYIHKCSNHPPVVIKNLPKSIMKRINTNSKNE